MLNSQVHTNFNPTHPVHRAQNMPPQQHIGISEHIQLNELYQAAGGVGHQQGQPQQGQYHNQINQGNESVWNGVHSWQHQPVQQMNPAHYPH